MKEINRSSVNQGQYVAPEFQKSGFDLSHKRYSSYLLGRIHASGYQDVMPGDKISGKNDGNFTFNRIVTPMVAPVDVAQYNMYIPYRALDRTFERAFAPSKNNNMSQSWTAPTFTLRKIIRKYIAAFLNQNDLDMHDVPAVVAFLFNVLYATDVSTLEDAMEAILPSSVTLKQFLYTGWTDDDSNAIPGVVQAFDSSVTSGKLASMSAPLYMQDALLDISEFVHSLLGSADNPLDATMTIEEFRTLVFTAMFDWSVGRFSYLAELGYNYVRPADIARMSLNIGFDGGAFNDFISQIDDTPQNEYALRAMYVIWYEHFRNVDLEPVSNSLPYWRDFGSTSVFQDPNNLLFTVYRIRSWYKDMFTTAQIDDLSRHVFAPVYANSEERIAGHINNVSNYFTSTTDDPSNPFGAASKPATYELTWVDQLSGERKNIHCPVPANINDLLSSSDLSDVEIFGLDLNSLRQAQMLERYLKRNYLFGDEYQDRMLAHYNSRVSDLRINRPEILSQSLNGSNMEQEVSNVSTERSNVGDRTATGTLQASGDQYTTYCEEFGIIINLITFMPQAAYNGICPQRLLGKVVDYPLPEFAADNEEFGRIREIADSALRFDTLPGHNQDYMFGRYPAYHAWRSRVDEVGGLFLNELQDCTFRRFWGLYSESTLPKLNYQFIHCRPNLQMFADTVRYNSQVYGDVIHECYVERVLPTPVEVI